MRVYDASGTQVATLVLGHGAGAGHDHPWMVRVANAFAARGIRVVTFDFPYMEKKKRGAPDPPAVLEAAFASVWREANAGGPQPGSPGVPRMFAGGKSMGGRIASQVAAAGGFDPAPAGLAFFGYPLHPPGKPNHRRDKHLPRITAPMLFLQGTRDPFGSADEMKALAAALPNATLEILDGGDHSLAAPKSQDPKGERLEQAIALAAAWIARSVPQ